MKLKSHGRYEYSAITERKDHSWACGSVQRCISISSTAGTVPGS